MNLVSTRWNVRSLAPSDLVACAQCMAIEADAFPHAGVEYGRSPRARVWVGRDDDRRSHRRSLPELDALLGSGRPRPVLGFVAAWRSPARLYIHALAVDAERRRAGLGRALLRTALTHARRHAIPVVALHVWTGNDAALALYRGEGFVIEKRVPDFYPAGAFGGSPEAYAMTLSLSPAPETPLPAR